MMNSFDILGIAPTDDKRAIKKAYSAKLKQYHPEEHPEKFAKINDAYRAALTYAPQIYTEHAEQTEIFAYDEYYADDFQNNFQNNFQNINIPAEQFYFQPDQAQSIFEDDAFTEETETTEAEEALQQFNYALLGTNGFLNIKKILATQEFVSYEPFLSAKKNPAFIRGLPSLFSRHPLSPIQIRIIRKALGIKKIAKHMHNNELSHALNELEKFLKIAHLKNYGYQPSGNQTFVDRFGFIIIMILAMLFSFIVALLRN